MGTEKGVFASVQSPIVSVFHHYADRELKEQLQVSGTLQIGFLTHWHDILSSACQKWCSFLLPLHLPLKKTQSFSESVLPNHLKVTFENIFNNPDTLVLPFQPLLHVMSASASPNIQNSPWVFSSGQLHTSAKRSPCLWSHTTHLYTNTYWQNTRTTA